MNEKALERKLVDLRDRKIPKCEAELTAARGERDALAVRLVLEHGASQRRAAELAGLSHSFVNGLLPDSSRRKVS